MLMPRLMPFRHPSVLRLSSFFSAARARPANRRARARGLRARSTCCVWVDAYDEEQREDAYEQLLLPPLPSFGRTQQGLAGLSSA